jgi:hypothetical protein
MKHRAVVGFVIAFATSAALFYPEQGEAFTRYVSAHGCQDNLALVDTATNAVKLHWGYTGLTYGFAYLGANGIGRAVCGVANDTSLDKSDIATLQVHVFDGTESYRISVQACGQSPTGTSIACGATTYNGGPEVTGSSTITVADLSQWSGMFNIYSPFLHIAVGKFGTAYSSIISYSWSD